MRVDLFLKLMGVTKTRMTAKRMCDARRVLRNAKPLKPSEEILAGQTLDLFLPQKQLRLKVLEVPEVKSVAKRDRVKYALFEGEKEGEDGFPAVL